MTIYTKSYNHKNIMLFAYNSAYEKGGMNDFIKCFNTHEEALDYAKIECYSYDYYEIVDSLRGIIKYYRYVDIFN